MPILRQVYGSLQEAYRTRIRPLEEHYNFPFFFSPVLQDVDIEAKPFILLLGQYSVGKTSFINHLLGSPRGYPGSHVGPEPTTDRFIAIMHGDQDRVLPGNLVSTSADKPFAGLAKFGNAFLSKFCCAEVKSEILNKVTLVDTPGVLAGEKQRVGRDYDMNEVTRWFAERSDIILLMFDAHKLDISDEFKEIIWHLRGHEEKIRIVLNKSDQVTPKQLLRVHGALMWSLGKFFQTPEVCRVYVSSFWGAPYASVSGSASVALFDSEKADLYADIGDIERYAAVRRVNEVIKRARLARAHALICATLRTMMPSLWGRQQKQTELIANLDIVFEAVSQEHRLPRGDLPDPVVYRKKLEAWTGTGNSLNLLPPLEKAKIDLITQCLEVDMPALQAPLFQDASLSSEVSFMDHPDASRLARGGGSCDAGAQDTGLERGREDERLLITGSSSGGDRAMEGVGRGGRGGLRGTGRGGKSAGATRGGRAVSAMATQGSQNESPMSASVENLEQAGGCGDIRDAHAHFDETESQIGGRVGGGHPVSETKLSLGASDLPSASTGHLQASAASYTPLSAKKRFHAPAASDSALMVSEISARVPARAVDEGVIHQGTGTRKCVVREFRASTGDELALEVGQHVYILELDSSGWLKGRNMASGREGWFPHNYVADSSGHRGS